MELIKTLQALTEGKVGPGLRLCLLTAVCSPSARPLCDCVLRCLALTAPLTREAGLPECGVAAARSVAVTWGRRGGTSCWCSIWPCQAAAHVKLVLLPHPLFSRFTWRLSGRG